MDMASKFGLIQDDSEGIDHHVEQKRGKGASLSNPTESGEVGADLPVDVNRGLTR